MLPPTWNAAKTIWSGRIELLGLPIRRQLFSARPCAGDGAEPFAENWLNPFLIIRSKGWNRAE